LSMSSIMSIDALAITIVLSTVRGRGFNNDACRYYTDCGSSSPAHFVDSVTFLL
jgi:hypothetical protein